MLFYRFLLAIVISVVTLLITTVLDIVLTRLPLVLQFLLQVPIIVILVDEGRRLLLANAARLDGTLSADDINGCFFFASPMATVGSLTLINSLEVLRFSK